MIYSFRHSCFHVPSLLLFAALSILPARGRAQTQNAASTLPDAPLPLAHNTPVTLKGTPRRILEDQEAIWTSPARLRASNALGPALLAIGTAVAITTDHQVMSSSRLKDTSLNDKASTASTGLTGAFIVAPAAIFGLGALHHDDHATEAGMLGGEAILDALAFSEVTKIISLRERPMIDSAKGRFFQSSVGFDSSFPSNHAIIAWSSAAVIASEYDGPLTQITAYGLATGVSAARVLARQHFPSDVLVGSAVGWMIGRYVVRRYHRTG